MKSYSFLLFQSFLSKEGYYFKKKSLDSYRKDKESFQRRVGRFRKKIKDRGEDARA